MKYLQKSSREIQVESFVTLREEWSKEMGELKKSITIPDPDNNFDAQPLIRASEMIDDLEILLSTIEKYNDKNSS